MKYVFTATTLSPDNEMLKSILEKADIPCMIRNEYLSMAAGEIPFIPPELWILNDEDYPRAKEIVDTWRTAKIENHGPWVCPRCHEEIEGQFTSCWKCGRER
jgi:Putative prokaryotic signal transducing protein